MTTDADLVALKKALEPFLAEARHAGYEDGVKAGVFSVYSAIGDNYEAARGGPELTAIVEKWLPFRTWMKETFPYIKDFFRI
jgi:hypothetical protein